MTPPPKLTDEQINVIVDAHTTDDHGYDIWCNGKGVARAIESARDQQWTEMLVGQVPVAWIEHNTGRNYDEDQLNWHQCETTDTPLYTHPRPDDTALLREALYVIQAWENDCDREDYWRDRDDAITKLTERLK